MLAVVSVLPLIHAPIGQPEDTITVHLVDLPFALVSGSIRPRETAFAMLFPVSIFSLVVAAIWPDFRTGSLLLVFVPISLITGSISVQIHPMTMGFAVLPFSFIGISIGQDETTEPKGLALMPKSNIFRAIWPDLYSKTLLDYRPWIELSRIDCVALDFDIPLKIQRKTRVDQACSLVALKILGATFECLLLFAE